MISVTKTYLPPLDEYTSHLKRIWERNQVTNDGECVKELEDQLRKRLGVKHVVLVNNGTTGLQIALKALDIRGEVITTPFSYVATTSSIVWENCVPRFADIHSGRLTIDPDEISKKISDKTTAIMATHIFGNVCDVEEIEAIASKNGLKVVYDAAHAFGVDYSGESILKRGNLSVLSFHATKLFHTVEGGAIVTEDDRLAHKAAYMRDFGHKGQYEFFGLGVNGKLSELHAAMGLCVLPKVGEIIGRRKETCDAYDSLLDFSKLEKMTCHPDITRNFAYYPVIFKTEESVMKTVGELNRNDIYPRRYFYPSLNTLDYVEDAPMTVADDISKRILCLPLSHEHDGGTVEKIAAVINNAVG